MDEKPVQVLKLGCLGPSGTFCEEAALSYQYKIGSLFEIVFFSSIREVIAAVNEGRADEAVVPLENSIEGTVNTTVDVLSHEVEVKLRGEIILPVEHCLLAKPGTSLEKVLAVVSHPQALAQCEKYIAGRFPDASLMPANSTAEAARMVSSSASDWAAIGSRRAAEVYGLFVLAANISDVACNRTRFVVLGSADAPPTGRDKTSLVFALAHRPGSLLSALTVLAGHGLNLTKIESRPSKRSLGEYWFFVDFEGHRLDPPVSSALEELQGHTFWYKVLGSYPFGQ